MNPKPVQCPGCGQSATGKFCSHCGTSIATACPSCGATIKPGSRACQECGASLKAAAAPAPWSAQTIAPWVAVGIAAFALILALTALFDRGGSVQAPTPELPAFSATAPLAGAPPDLSSMSPRQAADRLFNRVMTASESGDEVEAARFMPMALQAYNNLGTLDNDARYHLALLHMAANDSQSARVQVGLLRQAVPNHLLALMVEHQIAERSGNKDSAARASKAFLAAYKAEIAIQRVEYRDHLNSIERFRKTAQPSGAEKN